MRHNGHSHTNLVGTSPIMIELMQEIDRVARSDAKVLITGESGAGRSWLPNRSMRTALGPRSPSLP